MINIDKSLHMLSDTGWGFSRFIPKIDWSKLVYQLLCTFAKQKVKVTNISSKPNKKLISTVLPSHPCKKGYDQVLLCVIIVIIETITFWGHFANYVFHNSKKG